MKVLVIDVGGTNIKLLATGQPERRKIPSGPRLTPQRLVAAVKKTTADWEYQRVSIGYPGLVVHGRIATDPRNLGRGWVGFDFAHAFGCPVKILNDAAMQALGSYEGGRMLFLGLGTGLGSAMIADGLLEPMELAHLPYKQGGTYEDYLGLRGIERLGRRRWRGHVSDVVQRLRVALEADCVVLGGGNVKLLKETPDGASIGSNMNAFVGGFRLWEPQRGGAAPAKRG